MLAWSLLSGVACYLVVALLTARAAYGVQRTRIIEREARWHAHGDPVARFETDDRPSAATGAFLFGLAWPLTMPAYCVYRCAAFVITAHPPPTGPEREHRAEDLQDRIRALEESLAEPLPEPHEETLRAPLEERQRQRR
jgi:hypothetical protein